MTPPDIDAIKINRATFSPLALRYAILEPLRYLFFRAAPPELRYSGNPAETKIVICAKNSMVEETPVQIKPRILLGGGGYVFNRAGLTDNMSSQAPMTESFGAIDSQNMLIVQGSNTLVIEAADEGVALLLADMASNFITWSSPHICNTFGFKTFGFPLQVSSVEMDKEDKEKFTASIGIPWVFESRWKIKEDALKLKDFFISIDAS